MGHIDDYITGTPNSTVNTMVHRVPFVYPIVSLCAVLGADGGQAVGSLNANVSVIEHL